MSEVFDVPVRISYWEERVGSWTREVSARRRTDLLKFVAVCDRQGLMYRLIVGDREVELSEVLS